METSTDIITYGEAGFVSSLIRENLIGEYYLFINPNAIGFGLGIFNNINENLNLKLVNTKTFSNGIVRLFYEMPSDLKIVSDIVG